MLNACRSAHADLLTAPETLAEEMDAHQRVRAYGSLAQEVMDAGAAGVVAMRYNVFVVTAAQFIREVYAGLLEGRELGAAVAIARRHLAASPMRRVIGEPLQLQDWLVPVVYEAAPLALLRGPAVSPGLVIDLRRTEDRERTSPAPAPPAGPDVGFYGRDETLLALDRAFDIHPVVLLQAWAGAGKTSTALEFARWYHLTGAVDMILFTSFTQHVSLARLLDQVGNRFGPELAAAEVRWAALDETARRDWALQVLSQVPVLWVWDNVEPVAGLPAGTSSAWTAAEQQELARFLRELGRYTSCRVLLTSRRDERGWLGHLPFRVDLPGMPMLERLELAEAVAARQPGGDQFGVVEKWLPLLEFTQGNPLTVTIVVRQALSEHLTTPDQVQALVDGLRAGAARVTDDAEQGRNASLTASLDYGFSEAFADADRAVLALLALFQGFVHVDVLCAMGSPGQPGGPVPAVAGLTREAGVALLDRAAEVGLLTAHGDGYYGVHPAVPWHLHGLFERHYGPPGTGAALAAVRSWTRVIGSLGSSYYGLYEAGHAEVIHFLGAEEANLLRACQLATSYGWHDPAVGAMQGLRALYDQTGRAIEWRRLVKALVPIMADPDTGGPLPDREEEWSLLNEYRVRIATQARNWPVAEELQDIGIAWRRERAADALAMLPGTLNDRQRNDIRSLAVALEQLGRILREQQQPGCVTPYLEELELFHRIGDRRGEAVVAFNLGHAYKDIVDMCDLDEAERWYQHCIDLLEEQDVLGRARSIGQLGAIALARSRRAPEARAAHDHLAKAAEAYLRSLELTPADAVHELATNHEALGDIFGALGDRDRALEHDQKAIQHYERQDNRYSTGRVRFNVAIRSEVSGRNHDALLYAHAALRDFESVGSGAATKADQARQLITHLTQEPPSERHTGPGHAS